MSIIYGFPPIIGLTPHTLILGSMPSRHSIQKQQYYAHPRNNFWLIMCEYLDLPMGSAYIELVKKIKQEHIALWDVLASCIRPGSLDSAIQISSEVINPIADLLETYPTITRIFFNGHKAEQIFIRHIQPTLISPILTMVRLPSTSPANARISFAQKKEIWLHHLHW